MKKRKNHQSKGEVLVDTRNANLNWKVEKETKDCEKNKKGEFVGKQPEPLNVGKGKTRKLSMF